MLVQFTLDPLSQWTFQTLLALAIADLIDTVKPR